MKSLEGINISMISPKCLCLDECPLRISLLWHRTPRGLAMSERLVDSIRSEVNEVAFVLYTIPYLPAVPVELLDSGGVDGMMCGAHVDSIIGVL